MALTGIERVNGQFGSVHLGSSDSKYVQLVRLSLPQTGYRLWTLALGCHSEGLSILRRFKPQIFDHCEVLPVPADECAILFDRDSGDE